MKQAKNDMIVSMKDIFVEFDGEVILNHIDLDIRDKEFVTILGPSGCGKTTTLRIIGGFLEPDSGEVYFDGRKINGLPPHKRNVNTVFQKYSLFPHLNVFDNIAFGMRIKKMPKDEIKKRVKEMLAIVDLKGYEKRSVARLSGGQQQRVAIASALWFAIRRFFCSTSLSARSTLNCVKICRMSLSRSSKKQILLLYMLPMTRRKPSQ